MGAQKEGDDQQSTSRRSMLLAARSISTESQILEYQQQFAQAWKRIPKLTKSLTTDVCALDNYLKNYHQMFCSVADWLFGKPTTFPDTDTVKDFLNTPRSLFAGQGFQDGEGRPMTFDAAKLNLTINWTRYAGQTSGNSGINVDQIRARTFHVLQKLGQTLGYQSQEFRRAFWTFIQNGSDAGAQSLEAHIVCHWWTLKSMLGLGVVVPPSEVQQATSSAALKDLDVEDEVRYSVALSIEDALQRAVNQANSEQRRIQENFLEDLVKKQKENASATVQARLVAEQQKIKAALEKTAVEDRF